MVPELGNFALTLAGVLALGGAAMGLVAPRDDVLQRATASVVFGQWGFSAIAFAALIYAFVIDDFSVAYVANQSNSLLPWYYKISAAWGGHEGSFLLWILIMGSWMLAFCIRSSQYPAQFTTRVLGILSLLNLGFICFALFTSNPFLRLIPLTPADGADLNPLLQDFGLIVHPPLLYAGYVGLAIPFALAVGADAGLSNIWTAKCTDFPSIDAAVEAYRETLGSINSARLDSIVIAVSGPVNAETVDVTNNHWLFNKRDLLTSLSLQRLLVINDFTAQALAQTDPGNNGNVKILPGVSDEKAPLLVIGPGTGLGVSALIPSANGPIPIEGEGGHVSFSPRSDDERALDAFIRRHSAHVSAEHFVSGVGLENIHHFLADRVGHPTGMTAPEIGKRAIEADGLCRDAAMMLLGILGTVITDNVLTLGCWRGVVISGGIMPKLAPLIAHSPFADRVRKTGLTEKLMETIPIWMSVDPYAGLRGAAVALGNAHLAPRALDA